MRKGIWFVAVLLILSLTGCAQKGDSSVSPDTVGESGPETSGLGAEVLEDTTAPETYPMTVAQAVLVDEQGDSWRTTTLSLRQDLLWIDAIRFVDADTVHIEYKAGAADGSFDIGEMNYDTKTGKIVSDTAGRSYALVYAVSPDLAAYRGLEQNSGAYYFINPQNGRVQDSVKTELAGYPARDKRHIAVADMDAFSVYFVDLETGERAAETRNLPSAGSDSLLSADIAILGYVFPQVICYEYAYRLEEEAFQGIGFLSADGSIDIRHEGHRGVDLLCENGRALINCNSEHQEGDPCQYMYALSERCELKETAIPTGRGAMSVDGERVFVLNSPGRAGEDRYTYRIYSQGEETPLYTLAETPDPANGTVGWMAVSPSGTTVVYGKNNVDIVILKKEGIGH